MMVNNKPTPQDKLQANNLMEEVAEILAPCVRCGMCNSLCPVFKTIREEAVSPRGKAIILSEKLLDKILFQCNLCKGCEVSCPLNIQICEAIGKAREAMILKGRGLKSNNEMIENIRKTGNPFGKGEIKKDKLYCC